MRAIQSAEDLQPLLDYYAGTLGELPGRLMAALSLLADLEYMEGWSETSPEVRLSLKLTTTLVADVFRRLIAQQADVDLKAEVEAMIAQWTNGGAI